MKPPAFAHIPLIHGPDGAKLTPENVNNGKLRNTFERKGKKLLASGVPPKDVAKNLGVSIPTLYRWVPASTHA